MSDPFDDLRLRDFLLFDRIATRGTITAAARELGIPKPTASRWLKALEERVGHTLVRRTTRVATLTDRGRAFHEASRSVLAAAAEARAAATGDEPAGTVRVSVPVPLGRLLGGRVIAAFRRELPRVRLEIALSNERVDLVADRFDLAIRGGPLPDSTLIGRRLARVPMWLYASARFVGTAPDEVPIVGAPGDEPLLRRFRPGGSPPAVVVDDRSAVADALVCGAGAGVLPAFLGEPPRAAGHVVRLSAEPLTTMDVHAVYLATQRDDIRLRTLIDQIAVELVAMLSSAGTLGPSRRDAP